MKAENIFNLASRHNQWLTVRQSTVAGNVANANTPGYKARDVKAFDDVLGEMQLKLTKTRSDHLDVSPNTAGVNEAEDDASWTIVHSGNSVNLEQEMLKAGEVHRSFALNTSVTKAYHRMLLSSTKG